MAKLTLKQARQLGVPEALLQGLKPEKRPSEKKRNYQGPSPQELLFNLLKREYPGAVWEHKPFEDRRYRIDIAFPEHLVCVEADGYRFHGLSRTGWQRDRDKRNLLALAGWTILAFSAKDILQDPRRCAEQVGEALSARRQAEP